jgi:Flp pilus assembly protein TadG
MRAGIRSRRERGNAMLEFTLAATFLIPMMIGTFQFGYGFYIYNRMVSSVQGGARYASLRDYDSSSTPSERFITAVSNVVVYGDPAGGTNPIVPGLTTDKVQVTAAMVGSVPDTVTVSIRNFSIYAVVATIDLSGKPSASFRYRGRVAASGAL